MNMELLRLVYEVPSEGCCKYLFFYLKNGEEAYDKARSLCEKYDLDAKRLEIFENNDFYRIDC